MSDAELTRLRLRFAEDPLFCKTCQLLLGMIKHGMPVNVLADAVAYIGEIAIGVANEQPRPPVQTGMVRRRIKP